MHYRKTTARMKVNAGLTLLIAEDNVGELYFIPLYPAIWNALLFFSPRKYETDIRN